MSFQSQIVLMELDIIFTFLQPGFVSVPAAASVYVQVFGSEALWNMHQLNPKHVTTFTS